MTSPANDNALLMWTPWGRVRAGTAAAVRARTNTRLADMGFGWTFNGGEGAVRAAVAAGLDNAFAGRPRVRLASSTALGRVR